MFLEQRQGADYPDMSGLKIGDVLLWYNDDPELFSPAWFVKKFSGSSFIHSGLLLSPVDKTVAESIADGFRLTVRLELYDAVQEGNIRVFRAVDEIDVFKIKEYAHEHYQKGYSFFDLLVRFPIYYLTGQRFFPNTPNEWTCAEAVERAYRSINYSLVDKPPDFVSPGDISKSKNLKEIVL